MRFRLQTLMIVVTVMALLCGGITSVFRVERGEGLSASQANKRLWNCRVPDDATDVWFTSSYRSTVVECTLPVHSFRDWCVKHGGEPMEFINGERFVFSRKLGEAVIITDGQDFMNAVKSSPDIWHRGVYDLKTGRAYFDYSGG